MCKDPSSFLQLRLQALELSTLYHGLWDMDLVLHVHLHGLGLLWSPDSGCRRS